MNKFGKNYFASANTGIGFVNWFEHINFNEKSDEGFQYILKGGAGCGKSTLMQKVGEYFENMGFHIERFYCSSDASSLDGVRIVEKNVSIVDGTSPHVWESQLPEISSKIINIGANINKKVAENRVQVLHAAKQKKMFFKMVYSSLAAAKSHYENIMTILKQDISAERVSAKVREITKKITFPKNAKVGKIRKLFLSAIDENGIFDLCESNNFNSIFEIDAGTIEKKLIFEKLITNLTNKGLSLTVFYDIVCPYQIEKIYIVETNTLFTAVNEHEYNKLSLSKFPELVNFYENERNYLNNNLKEAGIYLAQARVQHQQIEKFYIKNIDFAAVENLTQNLIKEIEKIDNIK